MNYNEKLVAFMQARQDKLGKEFHYFLCLDKADIMSWDSLLAEYMWKIIRYNAVVKGQYEFSTLLCPFCILYTYTCRKCSYGQRHGICGKEWSTFSRIPKNVSKLFTNEYYLALLAEIEQTEIEDLIL